MRGRGTILPEPCGQCGRARAATVSRTSRGLLPSSPPRHALTPVLSPHHPRSKGSVPLTTFQPPVPGSSSVGIWTTSPITCSLVPSTSKMARPTPCAMLSPRSLVLSLTLPATIRWVPSVGPGCRCREWVLPTQEPTPIALQLEDALVPRGEGAVLCPPHHLPLPCALLPHWAFLQSLPLS